MRKKLYKIVAIVMAASMMSMTAFAAEETTVRNSHNDSDSAHENDGGGEEPSDSNGGDNTETPSAKSESSDSKGDEQTPEPTNRESEDKNHVETQNDEPKDNGGGESTHDEKPADDTNKDQGVDSNKNDEPKQDSQQTQEGSSTKEEKNDEVPEQKQEETPSQEEKKDEGVGQKQEESTSQEEKKEENTQPKQEETPSKEEKTEENTQPKQEETPSKEEKTEENTQPKQEETPSKEVEQEKSVENTQQKDDAASEASSKDNSGSDKKQDEASKDTNDEKTDKSSDDAKTGASTDDKENKDNKDNKDNTDNTDTATSASTEDKKDEKTEEVKDKEAETETPAESEEKEQRRSAQNDETTDTSQEQATNWSNGEVKDVMGIKAESNGDTVTISYKVKHDNDWTRPAADNPITVTLADGTTKTIQVDWNYGLHGDNWSDINGASLSRSSDQTDTEILEITIPAEWFGSDEFTVSGGEYISALNAPKVADNDNIGEEAVYTGIAVDGDFSDWNAVTKTDLAEHTDYNGEVDQVAWRVEEDYVYIYVSSPSGDGANAESATWAGTHGNGKFAITTDLGKTYLIQVTQDGGLNGSDDATVVHNGSQWEIAIPVSSLPDNNGGLNFGLYLQDPVLSGSIPGKEVTSRTDIQYDGNTGEWTEYPHSLIQYATAGTQEMVPDGEAAIYTDNYIYGHCETVMQAHLNERGTEYTQAVTVAANIASKVGNGYKVEGDHYYAQEDLHMRLAVADEYGNINWNPDFSNLENGSYEYLIFDTSCWGTSTNVSELNENDVLYGKATIIVTDGKQEMEWYVDPDKLAARYGLSGTDIKTVSSQYGKIGRQWVSSAGTSTGPVGSFVLIAASAAAPFLKKSKFVLDLISNIKIG